jgi:hypothetical protein
LYCQPTWHPTGQTSSSLTGRCGSPCAARATGLAACTGQGGWPTGGPQGHCTPAQGRPGAVTWRSLSSAEHSGDKDGALAASLCDLRAISPPICGLVCDNSEMHTPLGQHRHPPRPHSRRTRSAQRPPRRSRRLSSRAAAWSRARRPGTGLTPGPLRTTPPTCSWRRCECAVALSLSGVEAARSSYAVRRRSGLPAACGDGACRHLHLPFDSPVRAPLGYFTTGGFSSQGSTPRRTTPSPPPRPASWATRTRP